MGVTSSPQTCLLCDTIPGPPMVPRSDQSCIPLPGPSMDSQTLPGAPEHTWPLLPERKGPRAPSVSGLCCCVSPARPPAAMAGGPSVEGGTLLFFRSPSRCGWGAAPCPLGSLAVVGAPLDEVLCRCPWAQRWACLVVSPRSRLGSREHLLQCPLIWGRYQPSPSTWVGGPSPPASQAGNPEATCGHVL